ncbi:hypothetical protein GCM10022198_11440 [Klugiella xanthotipulae]|uniref:EamA family transporter n=1 Tax=Klugiella xanthotipulae TaxID=244735 RepID=UPI001B884EAD|nr:EamA family transporter [Klugiella xanthotipulae]
MAIGSVGIQISSALSAGLFDSLGSYSVSSIRMLIAAFVLLVVFRPKIKRVTKKDWVGITLYGASMAVMNLALYAAIDRLPLGIAVSLDFLGPCAIALLASKRFKEGACAAGALLGVLLIAGPGGYFNMIGYLFGLLAATAFAVYTFFSEKVGKSEGVLLTSRSRFR